MEKKIRKRTTKCNRKKQQQQVRRHSTKAAQEDGRTPVNEVNAGNLENNSKERFMTKVKLILFEVLYRDYIVKE